MDKNYVSAKQLKSVRMVSMEIMKHLMFEENQEISQTILSVLLDEIRRDRDGEIIERMQLKNAINMLLEIDIVQYATPGQTYSSVPTYSYHNSDKFYKYYFESKLIRETAKYYSEEGQEKIRTLNIQQYIQHVKVRLESECERTKAYLFQSSEKPIKENFLINMIVNQAQYCIKQENHGLIHFLEMENYAVIKDMYDLYIQNSLSNDVFLDGLVKFIIMKGAQILQDRKQVKNEETNALLEKLIQLYEQIDTLYKTCLTSGNLAQQQQLGHQIRDAFEQVANQDLYVTVQLNRNLDLCFRKDFKTLSTDEADARLKRNFYIFRLIKQKDIFENHYKKLLCKRLIEGTSLSDDFEKLFVNKMKIECGSNFTSKIETMFKDIDTSKNEMIDFKKNLRQVSSSQQKTYVSSIDLEISVLTMGHWPLQDPINFRQIIIKNIITSLSDELKFWKNSFEKHYINKNKQRKLNWFPNLGFVDLRAHYPQGKKKEFIASTLQACILLLFNQQEKQTLQEIADKIDIKPEFIKKELVPLLQLQIIIKQSRKPFQQQQDQIQDEINPDDLILYNSQFTHRSYKLKLMLQQNLQELFKVKNEKEEKQEDQVVEQISQDVMLERKFVIESMIVRVMKTRKSLDHQKLMEQVVNLATEKHFVPDTILIKQCIENLISRDYLSRSEENQNCYTYRA